MQPSPPRAQAESDLLRAWTAALNITVAELPAGDEQAARQALDAYPRPEFVRAHVELLVEHVGADPARLAAAAEAARAKHAELTEAGQTGNRTRHYLTAAILAERGLVVIRDAAPKTTRQRSRNWPRQSARAGFRNPSRSARRFWTGTGCLVAWQGGSILAGTTGA